MNAADFINQVPNCFARAIKPDDIAGNFWKELFVGPGVRAMLFDAQGSGQEFRPGATTIQTFLDQFNFFKSKQAQIVLVLEGDIHVSFQLENVRTANYQPINVSLDASFAIEDLEYFARFTLGLNAKFTIDEIRQALHAHVRHAVASALSLEEDEGITCPEVASRCVHKLKSALPPLLARIGLQLTQVFGLTVHQWQRTQLDDIGRQEVEQELTALRADTKLDALEKQIELKSRQYRLNQQWRESISVARLEKLQTEEAFTNYLHEQTKRGVLRDSDLEDYQRIYREAGQDKELARKRLLQRQEEAWQAETALLRADYQFELDLKRTTKDFELAQLVRHDDHRKAVDDIELTKLQLDLENLKGEHQRRIKLAEIRLEKEAADLKRAIRVDDAEVEDRRLEKIRERQFKTMATFQQINRDNDAHRQKLDAEDREQLAKLELARLQTTTQAEIERMQASRGMNAAELIATIPLPNAQLIAQAEIEKAKIAASAAQNSSMGKEEIALAKAQAAEDLVNKLEQSHEKRHADQQSTQQQLFGLAEMMIRAQTSGNPPAPAVVFSPSIPTPTAMYHVNPTSPSAPNQLPQRVCGTCKNTWPADYNACPRCGGKLI